LEDFRPLLEEKPFFNEMLTYFESEKVFLDIGSYHGFYSLFAAKYGMNVYSFEVNLLDVERIRKNVEMNEFQNFSSVPTIVSEVSNDINTKLDYYCEDIEVSLIKIDTDGGEIEVLEGAKHIIDRDRPTIFLECHGKDLKNESLSILENYGYEIINQWKRRGVNLLILEND
jgi:predicted RNA methylase